MKEGEARAAARAIWLDLTASVDIGKRKIKKRDLPLCFFYNSTSDNATSKSKSGEQIRNWILSLGFSLDGSRNHRG